MALPLKKIQTALFNEPEQYHALDKWGYFSLLTGSSSGRKHQESYKLYQMPQVIELANKNIDSWISQAEFSAPNRRVVNLARIGLLFADIDCYKVAWAQGKT
ncbi:MAG: replication protein, partial [Comamonas sp.]